MHCLWDTIRGMHLSKQTSLRYKNGELSTWKEAAELQAITISTYIRLTMNKQANDDLEKAQAPRE